MALFIRTFVWILATSLALGTAGIAAAAWHKANEPTAIRAGMAGDFQTLAWLCCGLALVFLALSIWQVFNLWKLVTKRPTAPQS